MKNITPSLIVVRNLSIAATVSLLFPRKPFPSHDMQRSRFPLGKGQLVGVEHAFFDDAIAVPWSVWGNIEEKAQEKDRNLSFFSSHKFYGK